MDERCVGWIESIELCRVGVGRHEFIDVMWISEKQMEGPGKRLGRSVATYKSHASTVLFTGERDEYLPADKKLTAASATAC